MDKKGLFLVSYDLAPPPPPPLAGLRKRDNLLTGGGRSQIMQQRESLVLTYTYINHSLAPVLYAHWEQRSLM